MPAVMRSQTMLREGEQCKVMEVRLTEMGHAIKKLIEEVGMLRRENATLRWTNEELVGGAEPSSNKHVKLRRVPKNTMTKEEGCEM